MPPLCSRVIEKLWRLNVQIRWPDGRGPSGITAEKEKISLAPWADGDGSETASIVEPRIARTKGSDNVHATDAMGPQSSSKAADQPRPDAATAPAG